MSDLTSYIWSYYLSSCTLQVKVMKYEIWNVTFTTHCVFGFLQNFSNHRSCWSGKWNKQMMDAVINLSYIDYTHQILSGIWEQTQTQKHRGWNMWPHFQFKKKKQQKKQIQAKCSLCRLEGDLQQRNNSRKVDVMTFAAFDLHKQNTWWSWGRIVSNGAHGKSGFESVPILIPSICPFDFLFTIEYQYWKNVTLQTFALLQYIANRI